MAAFNPTDTLLGEIHSLNAYQALWDQIRQGQDVASLSLLRSLRLPVLTLLHQDLQRPILYVTDRTDRTVNQLDEIRFWLGEEEPYHFPAPTPLFYEIAEWGAGARQNRLVCFARLAAYHLPFYKDDRPAPLIMAPLRAIMARTFSRRDFLKNSTNLRQGARVQPEELRRQWVGIGYEAADSVYERGTFSQRGGILDVWVPSEPMPLRLDFFGDEVDSIRRFDPTTQRSLEKIEQVWVTPAREVLPVEAVKQDIPFDQIDEFQIPVAHPDISCVLDFLPKNTLIIMEDQELLRDRTEEVELMALKERQDGLDLGVLPEDFPRPYLTWSEMEDRMQALQKIELGYSAAEQDSELSRHFAPGERFNGRLKEVIDDMLEHANQGQASVVVSRQASRLQGLWHDQTGYLGLDLTEPTFWDDSLDEGWVLTCDDGGKVFLYTDGEIFGWGRPTSRRRRLETPVSPEAIYEGFAVGDYVVHVDHGIGKFKGLVRRVLEGVEREYLCVEYANEDELFVPIHQADRLSRYIGADARTPKIARVGSGEWKQSRQKVQESLVEVAEELLEIYARRQLVPGYAFSNDTPWQQELEASFPYFETPDQIKAIQEVKRDMERPRPMDRLLCGDVGYGKTEVALRAAFKAVMDGKQVALLAPTTVLAQQHFDTFSQRLGVFPVKVEMLSRFRTPREQTHILHQLYKGEVDIVIGTHRLLQGDVLFKDLGLLIIDEEQRFGVAHKEYFKKMRTELDVLTLTATPIPRTLYMALTGARDISTINTPPQERLPIITHIGPSSDRIIRQAILRELERGGQIFFVHNRVMTIDGMYRYLSNLVPEARIDIGHGQMPEAELSDVMHRFTYGDIDVLLCTSIIESGLDIPNANTLIVDRADTFGLAQLYQLRGRVGRGAQRAYAYFFRHRTKTPTPEGLERMEVIAENTQLGAGYSIAMRDLEMRGAGELLGTRQHGSIQTVGFHLYTRMLAQAVHQLRQDGAFSLPPGSLPRIKEIAMPVSVELPLPVGITATYVPKQDLRLKLYQRIADLEDQQSISEMMEEFSDRFGELPEETRNLFYQMRVKLLAEEAGLSSIAMEDDRIALRFPPLPENQKKRDLPVLGMDTRAGKNGYWILLKKGTDWREHLLQVLYELLRELKVRTL